MTSSIGIDVNKSKTDQIIDEIIATETAYIKELTDIIDGYETPVVDNIDTLQISDDDVLALFNNIEEIRDFTVYMLKSLQKCHYDVKRISNCLVSIWESDVGLKLYSDYCTLYPTTIEVLTKCTKNPVVNQFFKDCQTQLGHMLPLGAYLIRPVQRVLRYPLLLEELDKSLPAEDETKEDIKAAYNTMIQVAEHINEVKKDYETSLLVKEIQSQLVGWKGNDLVTYGDLVEQETFKYLGGKPTNCAPIIHLATEHHFLLFDELLLLTKKKEDHFVYQYHINVEDLQIDGRIPRFPLCFELYEVSTDKVFIFIADTFDHKMEWVKRVDKVIERKIHMGLSDTTKLLILAGMNTISGYGATQKSSVSSDGDSPKKKKPNSKELEELLRKQRKRVIKIKSPMLSHRPVSSSGDGKEAENKSKSKRHAAYLLKRSHSFDSSFDDYHSNVGVVSKETLLGDFLHEDTTTMAVAMQHSIQCKEAVRRSETSATQFTNRAPQHHPTDTSIVTQPVTHNDCGTNNKLSSSAMMAYHESSTSDGVDELSRTLAEQQINCDDLFEEMRPREASIVLPPPSDFAAAIPEQQCYNKSPDDNSKIIITATTTSSSDKHHHDHQGMEEKRKHGDLNTWIV